MLLTEKRILQDEIYFMNRQVITSCDLKIKIYIYKIGFKLMKRKV